jgi:hypothetical protein
MQTFALERRLEIKGNWLGGIGLNGFSFDCSQSRNRIASSWKGEEKAVRVRKFEESSLTQERTTGIS